jgi:hypothetical protein
MLRVREMYGMFQIEIDAIETDFFVASIKHPAGITVTWSQKSISTLFSRDTVSKCGLKYDGDIVRACKSALEEQDVYVIEPYVE